MSGHWENFREDIDEDSREDSMKALGTALFRWMGGGGYWVRFCGQLQRGLGNVGMTKNYEGPWR